MKRFLTTLILAASVLFVAGIAMHSLAQVGAAKEEAKEKDRDPKSSKSKTVAKPLTSFQPTERVPVDTAVDFPVDI